MHWRGKNIFIRKMVSGGGKKTETPPALASQLNVDWRIKFKQKELHFCLAMIYNNELTACFSVCFCAPYFKLTTNEGALLESTLHGAGPNWGCPRRSSMASPGVWCPHSLNPPWRGSRWITRSWISPHPCGSPSLSSWLRAGTECKPAQGTEHASYRLVCHHLGFLYIKVHV